MDELPLKLSDATGVPFYRQIVDQVAELIRGGRLEPGAQLPSVRDLAAQLLVSLITTRRAYADLEVAGLIVRRQGYGTFVAEDITMATRDQTKSEVREHVASVVGHARRLGLSENEVREIFESVLEEGEPDVQ